MLKDLVWKNRSYRGYNEAREIKREELLDMVDHARMTASSINAQPLKYYLAYDKETVAKIQPRTGWAKALPQLTLPHPGMCPTGFIVILQDTAIDGNLSRYMKDCGIAAQTILLRAVEMGLGGCMIGSFHAGNVKEALDLSENLVPLLVVAIGEPKEEIVIQEIGPEGDIHYYRDDQDVHYVPKRKLEDIVVE